ncbi:MAG: rod-binding protein [Gemmatimonadaceae bacterium]
MNRIDGLQASGARDVPNDRRLEQAVRQLEGVFVEQLFKAMRETVPDDGVVNGGAGENMFTSMLDQRMADLVPQQWSSSLGEALLQRFRGALAASPDGETR